MKKLFRKLKKGFTLVELAIVIAVIAILIAVLVPTFVALIDKANESKDSQLVKNLNTAITIENATDEITTMHEAIQAAEANGYIVSQITPTSDGYDVLWDQETKYFLLADSDGKVVYPTTTYSDVNTNSSQFWKIIESADDISSKYSNYIAYDPNGATIVASTGVDVGNYTNVTVVVTSNTSNYASTKTKVNTNPAEAAEEVATIPTIMATCNGNGLTIDVDTTKASVVINGTTSTNVEIKAGVVTIAKKAEVPNYYISGSNVTLTNNSSVTINYVTKDGITATVNGNANNAGTADSTTLALFAGGFGTEASPYQIATATQFKNIGKLSDAMSDGTAYYFELTDNIDLSTIESDIDSLDGDKYITKYFCGSLDGNGNTLYGLENSNLMFIYANKKDVSITDLTVYQQGGYALTLLVNGNGKSYTGYEYFGSITFQDITIKGDKITNFGNNGSSFISYAGCTVNLINCTNSVDIAGTNAVYFGIFIGGYVMNGKVNFGSDESPDYHYRDNRITFNNCVNTATVTGSHIGFFTGNANQANFYMVENADFSDIDETNTNGAAVYITNCKNTGRMQATAYCGIFAETNGSGDKCNEGTNATTNQALNKTLLANADKFDNKGTMSVSSCTITTSLNGDSLTVTTDATGTISISITYRVSVSYKNVGSNYVWVTLTADSDSDVPYVKEIIDGSASSYTYGNSSYAELTNAETGNTNSSTDSYGHSYKLVDCGDYYVIIVGSISLMENATGYSMGSSVTYSISVSQNGTELGTLTGNVSGLTSSSN